MVGNELVLIGCFNFDGELGYGSGTAFNGDYNCGPLPATRGSGPDPTDHSDPSWRQGRPTEEFLREPPNAGFEMQKVARATQGVSSNVSLCVRTRF